MQLPGINFCCSLLSVSCSSFFFSNATSAVADVSVPSNGSDLWINTRDGIPFVLFAMKFDTLRSLIEHREEAKGAEEENFGIRFSQAAEEQRAGATKQATQTHKGTAT